MESARSFADVIYDILNNWIMLISFLLAIMVILACILISLWIFKRLFRMTPTSLQFSSKGARVFFEVTGQKVKEYILVVHPRGWQSWGIKVKAGDQMSFVADGSVHICLQTILEKISLRHKFEKQLIDQGKVVKHSDSSDLPEDLFTQEQREELMKPPNWIGPAGDTGHITDYEFPPRMQRKLIPDAPYGALIGAVNYGQDGSFPNATNSQIFLIGGENTIPVGNEDGELWLTINDVWDSRDREFPNKFYVDNIGLFFVKIEIKND